MKDKTAWVIWFYDNLGPNEWASIKDSFDKLKVHLRPGADPRHIKMVFAHFVDESKETPFLIDLVLGEENLTYEQPPR